IRGGDPTAPLTAANRVLTLNGGVSVLGGSTVQAAFTSAGGVVTNPTLLQFAGGFNLGAPGGINPTGGNLTSANQLLLDVTDVAGSGLLPNQPVALILASGTGGFSLNSSPAPMTIDPALYAATFHGFSVLPGSVSLVASASNLVLNFTPVP